MLCLKLSADKDTPEWSLVELQGNIALPQDWEEQTVVDLGNLTLSPENEDVVQLTFGHHQMEGKVVSLKKPLAVLDSVISSPDESSPERKIIGVIKQKYVFKARPRPLITKPDL